MHYIQICHPHPAEKLATMIPERVLAITSSSTTTRIFLDTRDRELVNRGIQASLSLEPRLRHLSQVFCLLQVLVSHQG